MLACSLCAVSDVDMLGLPWWNNNIDFAELYISARLRIYTGLGGKINVI
jgi:hypothetical protein